MLGTRSASVATPAPRAATRPATLRQLWRYRWPYVFVSPFFILFAVFYVYPVGFSLWLSLHEWRGLGPLRWVGLDNYATLLKDSLFWNSMLNSVVLFFMYVPLMTFLALVLASVLNSGFLKLQGLWRLLVFVPNITSMVAVGYTFQLMLSQNNGLFNLVLSWFGVPGVPWLGDTWWARISLSLLMIWAWLGYNTVLMLAGLQTIPRDLVESAKVDGASAAQAFFRITIPLMRPVILFSVTLSVIGTFSMFVEPYTLTRGGPARATETPMMQIFDTAFSFLKLGYASAMAYVYLAIIATAAIVQVRVFSRSDTA